MSLFICQLISARFFSYFANFMDFYSRNASRIIISSVFMWKPFKSLGTVYRTNGPIVDWICAPDHSVFARFPVLLFPVQHHGGGPGVCSGHFCSLTVKWEHCSVSHLKSSLFFQHSFPQFFSAVKVTTQTCPVLGQKCFVFVKQSYSLYNDTLLREQ